MVDFTTEEIPKFAWIILVILGCLDLARGIMHTVFLPYAAENIMGLNLSVARDDQLLLLGTFGISNYLTGLMLILIGLKARNIVPYVFLIIPVSYVTGSLFIGLVADSSAKLGGLPMMIGYLVVCIGTLFAIVIWKKVKHPKNKNNLGS